LSEIECRLKIREITSVSTTTELIGLRARPLIFPELSQKLEEVLSTRRVILGEMKKIVPANRRLQNESPHWNPLFLGRRFTHDLSSPRVYRCNLSTAIRIERRGIMLPCPRPDDRSRRGLLRPTEVLLHLQKNEIPAHLGSGRSSGHTGDAVSKEDWNCSRLSRADHSSKISCRSLILGGGNRALRCGPALRRTSVKYAVVSRAGRARGTRARPAARFRIAVHCPKGTDAARRQRRHIGRVSAPWHAT
jgi:hypothetical protein